MGTSSGLGVSGRASADDTGLRQGVISAKAVKEEGAWLW